MHRRMLKLFSVVCLSLLPFVGGCPGEDAVIGGVADGVSGGVAAFVEGWLSDSLEK